MRSKRVRAAQNKGGRRGQNSNDFISKIPDDVLLCILCLMPLKDAVVTSVLSTRWRYVWCHLTDLNFDDCEAFDKIAKNRSLCITERPKYIDRVNSVIRQHKGPTVQDFRVRFDLNDSSGTAIDKWIEFAISKKVQMLELDFLENGGKFRNPEQNYVFQRKLLDKRVGFAFKWPSLNVTTMKIPFLKKLFVKSVTVDEEILEILLKNCPVLETLSIHGSGYLTNVDIGGRSLALKHLELLYCFGVESICIYDFNLVSFTNEGSATDLSLVKLPKLEELYISAENSGFENNMFAQISSSVSNLQVLTLDVSHPQEGLKVTSIPEMPKVKKLTLKIGAWNDNCLLEFTLLAKSCPSLETIAIELAWFTPLKRRRKLRQVANHSHRYLKTLEIMGYFGRISDLELAVYFIDNAAALEKILIDPRCKGPTQSLIAKDLSKKEKVARSSAKRHLESRTPRGVELVIL